MSFKACKIRIIIVVGLCIHAEIALLDFMHEIEGYNKYILFYLWNLLWQLNCFGDLYFIIGWQQF